MSLPPVGLPRYGRRGDLDEGGTVSLGRHVRLSSKPRSGLMTVEADFNNDIDYTLNNHTMHTFVLYLYTKYIPEGMFFKIIVWLCVTVH